MSLIRDRTECTAETNELVLLSYKVKVAAPVYKPFLEWSLSQEGGWGGGFIEKEIQNFWILEKFTKIYAKKSSSKNCRKILDLNNN